MNQVIIATCRLGSSIPKRLTDHLAGRVTGCGTGIWFPVGGPSCQMVW